MAIRFAHPESEKKMLQRQRRHSGSQRRSNVIFGGEETMVVFAKGGFQRIHIPLPLAADVFRSGCFDAEGNLWLGTKDSGLLRLRPKQTWSYSINDGLRSDLVHSIAEDSHGNLWFATEDGLSQSAGLTGKSMPKPSELEHHFTEPGILVANRLRSVVAHPEGEVWAGLHGGGVHRWRDGQWTGFYLPGDHDDNKVNTVLPDGGLVWVGTVRRLHVLSAGRTLSLVQEKTDEPVLVFRE
jgi:ligand-binding sensor domain-containing protein